MIGVVALARAEALTTRPANVDVETRGDLTRGMSVIDTRSESKEEANVDLATKVDVAFVRKYMESTLSLADSNA